MTITRVLTKLLLPGVFSEGVGARREEEKKGVKIEMQLYRACSVAFICCLTKRGGARRGSRGTGADCNDGEGVVVAVAGVGYRCRIR